MFKMSSLDCSVGLSESVDMFNCELSSDNKLHNAGNIDVIDNIVNELCDADKIPNQLSDGTAQDVYEGNTFNMQKGTEEDSDDICASKMQLCVNKKDENIELSQTRCESFVDNDSDNVDRIDLKDNQEILNVCGSISAIVTDVQSNNDTLESNMDISLTNVLGCCENRQAGNCEKSDSVATSLMIEAELKDVDVVRESCINDLAAKRKEVQNCNSETRTDASKMDNRCFPNREIIKIVETEKNSENNVEENEKSRTGNKEKQDIKKDEPIQMDDERVELKKVCLESLASDKMDDPLGPVMKDSVFSDSKPEDSWMNLKSFGMDISSKSNNEDGDKNKPTDVSKMQIISETTKVSHTKKLSEQRHDESLDKSITSSNKRWKGDIVNEDPSQRVSSDESSKKDTAELSGDHSSRRDRSSDKCRSPERSRSYKRSRSRDQSRSVRDRSSRRRRNSRSRSRSNERPDANSRDRQRKSPHGRSDRETKRRSRSPIRSPIDSEYLRKNRPWTERRTSDHCDDKIFDLREKISRTRMNSNGMEVYDESFRSGADVSVEQSRRFSSRGDEGNTGPSFSRNRDRMHRGNLRDFDAKKVSPNEKCIDKGSGEFKWRGNRDEVPMSSERNSRQYDYGRSGGNRDRSETDRRQDRRRDRDRSVENRDRIDRKDNDKKLEDIVSESLARIRRSGEGSSLGISGTNIETPPRRAISNNTSSNHDGRENGNTPSNKIDNTNSAIHVVLSQSSGPPNRFKPLSDSSSRNRNSTIEIIADDDGDDEAMQKTMNQSVVVNVHEPPPNVNIHEPPPNFFSSSFGAVTRQALPEGNRFCTPPPGFDHISPQFPRGASVVHQLPMGVPFDHLVTHHQLLRAPPSGVLLRGQPPDVCIERPGAEFRLAAPPSTGQQQQVRMEWRMVNPKEMMTLHRFPVPQFFGPGSIHNGPGGQGLIRTGMGPNDLIPVSMQPQVMTLQPGHQFTPTSIGTIVSLDGSMQHIVSSGDAGQMVQLGMLMNRPPLMAVGSHLSSHLARIQQPPPMHGISAIPLPTRAMMYLNPSETINQSTPATHSTNPSPVLNSSLTPMLRSVQSTSGASYPMDIGDQLLRHGHLPPVGPPPTRNESNPLPPSSLKPNSYFSISPVEMSESEEEKEADNLSDEDHEEPVTIYRNDSAADFAANVSSKQWHGSSQTGTGCSMPSREPIPSARLEGTNRSTLNVYTRNKHASDSVSSENSSDEDEVNDNAIVDGSVDRGAKAPLGDLNQSDIKRPMTSGFAQSVVSQPPRFTSAGFSRVETNVERISIDDSQSSPDSVKIIRPPVNVKFPANVQHPVLPTNPNIVSRFETLDDSVSSEDSDNAVAPDPPTNFPVFALPGKQQTSATGAGEVSRVPAAADVNIVPAAVKTKQTMEKLSEDSFDKTKKSKEIMDRVVEEVKTALKPYYAKLSITKDEYKDIMRRAVPKICRSTKTDVLPAKIQEFIDQYVAKVTHRSGGKKRETASRTGAGHTGKPPHRSSKTS